MDFREEKILYFKESYWRHLKESSSFSSEKIFLENSGSQFQIVFEVVLFIKIVLCQKIRILLVFFTWIHDFVWIKGLSNYKVQGESGQNSILLKKNVQKKLSRITLHNFIDINNFFCRKTLLSLNYSLREVIIPLNNGILLKPLRLGKPNLFSKNSQYLKI